MNNIGWAVKEMQNGEKVCRSSWNGKGMWLRIMQPHTNDNMMTVPFVFMHTVQKDLIPWNCSQADLLATDWELAV